jgi:DinB superfamily
MTDDELVDTLNAAFSALGALADRDWKRIAGSLEWTCWQTIDHTIDCVHSFALQIGAQADSGFLPFAPMHADAEATPSDLIDGLRGVSALLIAIARDTPPDRTASDGVVNLSVADWRARTAYEVALHTYDVVAGLGGSFSLSAELSASITRNPALWMLDRGRAQGASGSWRGLVEGSGR